MPGVLVRRNGSRDPSAAVGTCLVLVAVLLVAVSAVVVRVPAFTALRDASLPWVELLDVRAEGSVHTWFNVVVLGGGALLAVLAASVHRHTGQRSWPWWALAGYLALLSLDDALALHERLDGLGHRLGGGQGALHFSWVVPGAALGVGAVVLVVMVARRLPRRAAVPVALGTALLVLAALGLELVGGAILAERVSGPWYGLVSHTEELLESLAACLLLVGVVRGVPLVEAGEPVVTKA